jgi:dipeptidyl aminopeptidase/acylaminoacyl peptidase
MKSLFILFTILLSPLLKAQMPDTDIWLFDITQQGASFSFSNPVNFTNRPGYDNQPSFSPDGKYILYTSYRDGQSDIYKYDIASKKTSAFCTTPTSEYSPTVTPDGKFVSVVMVEKDSTQRLWKFPVKGGEPVLVLKDVDSVGYYAWINMDSLIVFLLTEPASLNLVSLKEQKPELLVKNPGRIFNSFLFLDKGDSTRWVIKDHLLRSDNHLMGQHYLSIETPKGSEDFAFSYETHRFFIGNGSIIYCVNPLPGDGSISKGWTRQQDLSVSGLKHITRMAISKDGKKIAIVSTK